MSFLFLLIRGALFNFSVGLDIFLLIGLCFWVLYSILLLLFNNFIDRLFNRLSGF